MEKIDKFFDQIWWCVLAILVLLLPHMVVSLTKEVTSSICDSVDFGFNFNIILGFVENPGVYIYIYNENMTALYLWK